ncbi:MAG TPA: acetolactate synthase large subunit, partial [Thermodesulfobacteriota bacterium]|nr:acetolactate synthase large subunit [Thermodesulfobacteriota bacterium]
LPGEENLGVLEALRQARIKVVITRHEQAAAFMAATYGRLTGKAGVCFSTLGPGATNLVTGVAHAQLIGAPLISISAQKPRKENWQGKFQLVDVVSLMRPITKKSVSIYDPNTIPTVLRDAFKTAEAERPGAVHIELPEDVAAEEANARIQERGRVRRPAPDARAVESAAELIRSAKAPLIMVSSGANRNRVSRQLAEFVERTGIYVVHTQMGKGVLPDTSDFSLFASGIHKQDYVNCGIDRADLVITVGYNIVEYPPYVWNRNLEKKILNIDFVESEPDQYFNPALEVVGDISQSLARIGEEIAEKRSFPVFAKARAMMEKIILEKGEPRFPLTPQQIVREVREVMSEDDIVALDNGIFKLWFSRLYRTFKPNTLLLDNALATMGAGLPAAIAAKLINPERKVLAFCGDGGFMMNSQELATAMRCRAPVVVLLLNDNAYGFVKWKQENMNFENFGMDLTNPAFPKFAESFGAKGFRMEKGQSLKELLSRAFSLNEVALVECPIDYSVNYDVFSVELGHLVCSKLGFA